MILIIGIIETHFIHMGKKMLITKKQTIKTTNKQTQIKETPKAKLTKPNKQNIVIIWKVVTKSLKINRKPKTKMIKKTKLMPMTNRASILTKMTRVTYSLRITSNKTKATRRMNISIGMLNSMMNMNMYFTTLTVWSGESQ